MVERIYEYFDEVNADPVVYHWKYKLEEIDPREEIQLRHYPLKSRVNF